MVSIDKANPKVSVIIPVYNAEPYLRQCMDTVINQTLREIEIICVDDGSTDNSADILEEYKKKDSRVSVYKQKNLYAGVARNNGLKKATGKYVIFWDSDDFFELDALQKMYERAESVEADIVVCNSIAYDDENKCDIEWDRSLNPLYMPKKEVFSKSDIPEYIFLLCVAWSWDKLFNREFIMKNNLQYGDSRTEEDVQFVFVALAVAEKITTLEDGLIHYRKYNPNSLENSRDDYWNSTVIMFKNFLQELKLRKLDVLLRRSFDNFMLMHMVSVLFMLKDINAYRKMYDSLKEYVIPLYGLNEHGADYYFEKYWYDRLRYMNKYSADKFIMMDLYSSRCNEERANLYMHIFERHFNKTSALLEEANQFYAKNKRWYFPFGRIPKGSDIVLYGAGDAGKDFYAQFTESGYCNVKLWVDNNYKSLKERGLNVSPVEDISVVLYDYIIIAVVERSTYEAIKADLLNKGIDAGKIIWVDLCSR